MEERNIPTTPQAIHETLYDGADLHVTYTDGQTEVVKVRKIPRNEFAQFGTVLTHEEREAAFYCNRTVEWAQRLDDDSFDRVLTEGQRLNFPRFAAWFKRQTARLELMASQDDLAARALKMLGTDPTLRSLLGSTSGSSAGDTGTQISGATPRRN